MGLHIDNFGIVDYENPIYENLDSLSYWVSLPFDIFIEEFVKLVPFLAILTLSTKYLNKIKE